MRKNSHTHLAFIYGGARFAHGNLPNIYFSIKYMSKQHKIVRFSAVYTKAGKFINLQFFYALECLYSCIFRCIYGKICVDQDARRRAAMNDFFAAGGQSSTPYDDVFRTLLVDCSKIL